MNRNALLCDVRVLK